jgi:formylglycine-generating enzyme required for sulfatase activity
MALFVAAFLGWWTYRESRARHVRELAAAEEAEEQAEKQRVAERAARRKAEEEAAQETARKKAEEEAAQEQARKEAEKEAGKKANEDVAVDLGDGVKLEMVLIPAGEFLMGSPDLDKGVSAEEIPQHRVRITKPFYLGKYEVTQEQWQAVMGNNPSSFSDKGDGQAQVASMDTKRFPVENVSWDDAMEFCKRLGQKEGLEYCLPTEAQWEYACRGGSMSRYCFGDNERSLIDYAIFGCVRPEVVGGRKPNTFGLYDMHGNVEEWVADWLFVPSSTGFSTATSSGLLRGIRGGGWNRLASECRCAFRDGRLTLHRSGHLGFRVCRPAGGEVTPPPLPSGSAPPVPDKVGEPGVKVSTSVPPIRASTASERLRSVALWRAVGEGPPITASLHYSDKLRDWGASYYRPKSVDLAKSPPNQQWIRPQPARSKQLFGILRFGTSTEVNVLVDVLDRSHSTVRFGINDDVRFDNKQTQPLGRSFDFNISYPDGTQQPYAIQLYQVAGSAPRLGAYRLWYYRACLREGVIEVAGKSYPIAIVDDDTTGDYSDPANISVLIRTTEPPPSSPVKPLSSSRTTSRSTLATKRPAPGDLQRAPGTSAFKLGGESYIVSAAACDGSTITIKRAACGELIGQTVNQKTRQPISEATVTVGAEASPKTGPDGRFTLRLPEGRYGHILVTAPGFVPKHDQSRFAVVASTRVELTEQLAPASAPKSGTITLHKGDSYHFLGQTMSQYGMGDFYLNSSSSDGVVKFWANINYQGGVVDLGDIGAKSLDEVTPPASEYQKYGVRAVVGHTYVSLAKAGEEGHYIIFRVIRLGGDRSVELEYYYR